MSISTRPGAAIEHLQVFPYREPSSIYAFGYSALVGEYQARGFVGFDGVLHDFGTGFRKQYPVPGEHDIDYIAKPGLRVQLAMGCVADTLSRYDLQGPPGLTIEDRRILIASMQNRADGVGL